MYIQHQASLLQHRCPKSFTIPYNVIKLDLPREKRNLVYHLYCTGFLMDKWNVSLNQYELQGCFRAFFRCYKLMQSGILSVSPTLTLSDSQDLKFSNTFPKLPLILSTKKKAKKNKQLEISYPFRSSNAFEATHTQRLQTYTHSLGVLQNISPWAYPDCQGNAVICDFIGENCIPPISIIGTILYLLGLLVYFGCLCVFWKVRVLTLCCKIGVGISCCHVEV